MAAPDAAPLACADADECAKSVDLESECSSPLARAPEESVASSSAGHSPPSPAATASPSATKWRPRALSDTADGHTASDDVATSPAPLVGRSPPARQAGGGGNGDFGVSDRSPAPEWGEFVESSRTKRFSRWASEIGSGAHKTIFRAWDHSDGRLVAWNVVSTALVSPAERARLSTEVEILCKLNSEHLIRCYESWVNDDSLVFVTPIVDSGDLRRFLISHREIKLKVIKRWCCQILRGLQYLHSLTPPIIHRDIKCENLLYNSADGTITIGDLGLATQQTVDVARLDATPNFMAPEMFEGKYDETIDVYAFGLCVLEMVTRRVPYDECANMVQIFNKVTRGIAPASLELVIHNSVRDFIAYCTQRLPDGRRPSAAEVLCHPFLTEPSADDDADVLAHHAESEVQPGSGMATPSNVDSRAVTVSLMPSDVEDDDHDNDDGASLTDSLMRPSRGVSMDAMESPMMPLTVDTNVAAGGHTQLASIVGAPPSALVSVCLTVCIGTQRHSATFDFSRTSSDVQQMARQLVSQFRTVSRIRIDDDAAVMFETFLRAMQLDADVAVRTGAVPRWGWSWVCMAPADTALLSLVSLDSADMRSPTHSSPAPHLACSSPSPVTVGDGAVMHHSAAFSSADHREARRAAAAAADAQDDAACGVLNFGSRPLGSVRPAVVYDESLPTYDADETNRTLSVSVTPEEDYYGGDDDDPFTGVEDGGGGADVEAPAPAPPNLPPRSGAMTYAAAVVGSMPRDAGSGDGATQTRVPTTAAVPSVTNVTAAAPSASQASKPPELPASSTPSTTAAAAATAAATATTASDRAGKASGGVSGGGGDDHRASGVVSDDVLPRAAAAAVLPRGAAHHDLSHGGADVHYDGGAAGGVGAGVGVSVGAGVGLGVGAARAAAPPHDHTVPPTLPVTRKSPASATRTIVGSDAASRADHPSSSASSSASASASASGSAVARSHAATNGLRSRTSSGGASGASSGAGAVSGVAGSAGGVSSSSSSSSSSGGGGGGGSVGARVGGGGGGSSAAAAAAGSHTTAGDGDEDSDGMEHDVSVSYRGDATPDPTASAGAWTPLLSAGHGHTPVPHHTAHAASSSTPRPMSSATPADAEARVSRGVSSHGEVVDGHSAEVHPADPVAAVPDAAARRASTAVRSLMRRPELAPLKPPQSVAPQHAHAGDRPAGGGGSDARPSNVHGGGPPTHPAGYAAMHHSTPASHAAPTGTPSASAGEQQAQLLNQISDIMRQKHGVVGGSSAAAAGGAASGVAGGVAGAHDPFASAPDGHASAPTHAAVAAVKSMAAPHTGLAPPMFVPASTPGGAPFMQPASSPAYHPSMMGMGGFGGGMPVTPHGAFPFAAVASPVLYGPSGHGSAMVPPHHPHPSMVPSTFHPFSSAGAVGPAAAAGAAASDDLIMLGPAPGPLSMHQQHQQQQQQQQQRYALPHTPLSGMPAAGAFIARWPTM